MLNLKQTGREQESLKYSVIRDIYWAERFQQLKMKWNELMKKKTQPTDVRSEFSYNPVVWTGSEFWDGPDSDRTGELKRLRIRKNIKYW